MNMHATPKQRATTALTLQSADVKKAMGHLKFSRSRYMTIPALGNVRIAFDPDTQTATLTTCDLGTETHIKIPARGPAKNTVILIHSGRLATLARAGVEIALTRKAEKADHFIHFEAGPVTGSLREICPTEDFPKPMKLENPKTITASPAQLHRLFSLGKHCISPEETRYYLKGTFLTTGDDGKTLRAVTTDGHRLAVIDSDIETPDLRQSDKPGPIIPQPAIAALCAALRPGSNSPATLAIDKRYFRFELDDVTITGRLIDGTFPNYKRVLKNIGGNNNATLTLAPIKTLRDISDCWFARAVAIDATSGTIALDGDPEIKAQFEINATGDGRIGINPKYLADTLNQCDPLRIEFGSSGDPALFKPEDPLAFFVIMPMRLSGTKILPKGKKS